MAGELAGELAGTAAAVKEKVKAKEKAPRVVRPTEIGLTSVTRDIAESSLTRAPFMMAAGQAPTRGPLVLAAVMACVVWMTTKLLHKGAESPIEDRGRIFVDRKLRETTTRPFQCQSPRGLRRSSSF